MIPGFCISDKYRTEINGLGKFFDDLRVAPFDSDPTLEDTDGDGLSDSDDAQPLCLHDERFIIVDTLNYIPKLDFVDKHIERGNECYNTKTGFIESLGAFAELSLFWTMAKGGEYTALLNLFLQGSISNVEYVNSVEFGVFLDHYLSNTGESYILSSESMYDIINGQTSNKQHYSYNINQMKKVAESIVTSKNTKKIPCIYLQILIVILKLLVIKVIIVVLMD